MTAAFLGFKKFTSLFYLRNEVFMKFQIECSLTGTGEFEQFQGSQDQINLEQKFILCLRVTSSIWTLILIFLVSFQKRQESVA